MHRSMKLCAICWIDSKPVFMLSMATNPIDPNDVVGQWIEHERMEYPTSSILLEYQRNMHGVDVVDQKRDYYTV
jgi:hypothetical protein